MNPKYILPLALFTIIGIGTYFENQEYQAEAKCRSDIVSRCLSRGDDKDLSKCADTARQVCDKVKS